jgi:uncharacterized protein YkwD
VRRYRIRRCLVTCLAAAGLALLLSGCAQVRARLTAQAAAAHPAATVMAAIDINAENQLVASVNRLRAEHHERPLALNAGLTNKARYWSRWMAAGNCGRGSNGVPMICHSNLAGGIHASWTLLEENVGAASPRTNVMGVAQGFANSPGHLANILNSKVTYLGVGVAYAGDTVYVTEEFMATS